MKKIFYAVLLSLILNTCFAKLALEAFPDTNIPENIISKVKRIKPQYAFKNKEGYSWNLEYGKYILTFKDEKDNRDVEKIIFNNDGKVDYRVVLDKLNNGTKVDFEIEYDDLPEIIRRNIQARNNQIIFHQFDEKDKEVGFLIIEEGDQFLFQKHNKEIFRR